MAKTKKKSAVVAATPVEISGKIVSFQILPSIPAREYIIVDSMPYGEARRCLGVKTFSALSTRDHGFQREMVESHRNKLKKAMVEGQYTPTVWSASVKKEHLVSATRENGRIKLSVSEDNPLDQTDGNHRKQAIGLVRKAYEEAKADGDQVAMDWIDKIPVSVQIFLDPEKTVGDFINCQKGLNIGKAQLESMELQAGMYPPHLQPHKKSAHKIGVLLFKDKDSHLFGQISFDSKGQGTFNINVLSAHSGSIVGNKLYGGALIAHDGAQKPEWMARIYTQAYQAILTYGQKDTVTEYGDEVSLPQLFVAGNVLSPPIHGGKKGGAEMLLGIGNMLAARCILMGQEEPTEDDLKLMVECAEEVYGVATEGNLSDSRKRQLLQVFSRHYFEDVIESQSLTEYAGIPMSIIEILSFSTFDLPPLGKDGQPTAKRGRPKREAELVEA